MEFLEAAARKREIYTQKLNFINQFINAPQKQLRFKLQNSFNEVEKSVNNMIKNSQYKQQLLQEKIGYQEEELSSETGRQEKSINGEYSDYSRIKAQPYSPIKNLIAERRQEQLLVKQMDQQNAAISEKQESLSNSLKFNSTVRFQPQEVSMGPAYEDAAAKLQNLRQFAVVQQPKTPKQVGQFQPQDMSLTGNSPVMVSTNITKPQSYDVAGSLAVSSAINRQQKNLAKSENVDQPKILPPSRDEFHARVQMELSRKPLQPQFSDTSLNVAKSITRSRGQDNQQDLDIVERIRNVNGQVQQIKAQQINRNKPYQQAENGQTEGPINDFQSKMDQIITRSRFKDQQHDLTASDMQVQTDHSHLVNESKRNIRSEKQRSFQEALIRSQLQAPPVRYDACVSQLTSGSQDYLNWKRGLNTVGAGYGL